MGVCASYCHHVTQCHILSTLHQCQAVMELNTLILSRWWVPERRQDYSALKDNFYVLTAVVSRWQILVGKYQGMRQGGTPNDWYRTIVRLTKWVNDTLQDKWFIEICYCLEHDDKHATFTSRIIPDWTLAKLVWQDVNYWENAGLPTAYRPRPSTGCNILLDETTSVPEIT